MSGPVLCFTNITIGACHSCMLSLLQESVIDKCHQNPVVPQPGSHCNLSYPLPHPPLSLNPQKETPHRVPWRWKAQLPSVGSRWTPSPFFSVLISPQQLFSWLSLLFHSSQSVLQLSSRCQILCRHVFVSIHYLPNSSLTCFPSLSIGDPHSWVVKWYQVIVRSWHFISINVNL